MIFKKLKSKRGISFAEVLCVVAIMTIMLGLAMPNLLSQSQEIDLATMDGYARSVAVAVQSRLYGMKNKGTSVGSEYWTLNNAAATDVEIIVDGETKTVKYVSNFAPGTDADALKKVETAKRLLFSAATTDTEVLRKGKIVVVYNPVTADVIEVFYSEREFDVKNLFPTVNESYLKNNNIGYYLGEGAPEPERNVGLPSFAVTWGDDDEKYLELTMKGNPDPTLLDKNLGLEIYALLPKDNSTERDPLLIYAEGLVADNYTTNNVEENPPYTPATKTIESEMSYPLTLEKIQKNEEDTLRFAIDSMVVARAMYDSVSVKKMLYRHISPKNVSAAEDVLYPRDSIDNWMNPKYNPYISFGIDAGLYSISENLQNKLDNEGTKVTDYVAPDEMIELRVKLYVLKEDDKGVYETQPINGGGVGSRYVPDEKYPPLEIESQPSSPYFYSFSDSSDEIALASMRDLQNLKYVFDSESTVKRARLYHDIEAQQLYEKLVKVRYALIGKDPSVNNEGSAFWNVASNWDVLYVDPIKYVDGGTQGFEITGAKSEPGGGCYAIKSIQNGGAGWNMGGIIQYAKNVTVKDLDIFNPKNWKIDFDPRFIQTNDDGEITGINIQWDSGVSGGLFGVAENCTFENVHCYNDLTQIYQQEKNEAVGSDKDNGERTPSGMAPRYVADVIAGGLAGIAVGTEGKETKFTKCGASDQVTFNYYRWGAQCLYAGGLAGVVMGNVTIENSYAACQLSGYYAGGLVGGVGKGPFKSEFRGYPNVEANYENVEGTLKINNSFSAGRIQRLTRVGGGLIAQIADGTKVDASNCYSATTWEILPPVAYGTFEGDTANYYLAQAKIAVPITLNIEAHFNVTGDVFSLKTKEKSGTATTEEKSGNAITKDQLATKFNADTGWTNSTRTSEWRYADNNLLYLPATDAEGTGDKSKEYPYPMPSGNTEFHGDWNHDPVENLNGTANAKFDGFYCTVYHIIDNAYGRKAEPNTVIAEKFNFGPDNYTLNTPIADDRKKDNDVWWAETFEDPMPQGEGVAAVTEVAVSNGKVTFKGAAYYNKDFDPTKGYSNIDVPAAGANSRYLNYDYYGWYFVGNEGSGKGYLSPSAEGESLHTTVGALQIDVKEEDFKKAIGYKEFSFTKNNAKLVYEDGYFQVKET